MSWALRLMNQTTGSSFGVELATPGISSSNIGVLYPDEQDRIRDRLLDANPQIGYLDVVHRGYMLVDIEADRIESRWYFVEVDAPDEQEFCGQQATLTRGAKNRLQMTQCD